MYRQWSTLCKQKRSCVITRVTNSSIGNRSIHEKRDLCETRLIDCHKPLFETTLYQISICKYYILIIYTHTSAYVLRLHITRFTRSKALLIAADESVELSDKVARRCNYVAISCTEKNKHESAENASF